MYGWRLPMSLATDLAAIETTIALVLENGQETSTADGKSLKWPSLKDLYEQKERIESEIAKESPTTVTRTVAHY